MENQPYEIRLHPELLDRLFAYKRKVSQIFRDVLGIHEIDHLAIACVNSQNQLLCYSSTPALEFNLFSQPLWHYDQTYSPQWFQQCMHSDWQSLYNKSRYDELYYLKQIKHQLPLGISMANKVSDLFSIFSFASHKSCNHTEELFSTSLEEFYQIGLYCLNQLKPLFNLAQEWGQSPVGTVPARNSQEWGQSPVGTVPARNSQEWGQPPVGAVPARNSKNRDCPHRGLSPFLLENHHETSK